VEDDTGGQVPLVRLVELTKRFGGNVAVNAVDFEVQAGEVHALVGENGAGKSTLMKMVDGLEQPDAGRIEIDGSPVQLGSSRDAERVGIAMIPQELDLFLELTVAENLHVGRSRPRHRWRGIDHAAMRSAAQQRLDDLGISIRAGVQVGTLSVADRQLVAIARALFGDARVVIMDEPTASLADRETRQLFKVIRDLGTRGVGVVYISHRLAEVFELADRITVLRDGEVVETRQAKAYDQDSLVRDMVGRPVSERFQRSPTAPGEILLELDGLSRAGEFEDVSLRLRAGEVVGLAGLVGAGRTELAQTVFGVRRARRGEIRLEGQSVRIRDPEQAMRHGVFYVPEERKSQGLIEPFSITRNVTLSSLARHTHGLLLAEGEERDTTEELMRRLAVRGGDADDLVANLSGGNQQKVVLAKALARRPRVLILDEPTRGVDVGSRSEIYGLTDELAGQGMAILLVSSDLDEVLAMSDRVLVMRAGRIAGELAGDEATPDAVMRLATGSDGDQAPERTPGSEVIQ
jgi:ABC-type sugar transport system ATPase subunit